MDHTRVEIVEMFKSTLLAVITFVLASLACMGSEPGDNPAASGGSKAAGKSTLTVRDYYGDGTASGQGFWTKGVVNSAELRAGAARSQELWAAVKKAAELRAAGQTVFVIRGRLYYADELCAPY